MKSALVACLLLASSAASALADTATLRLENVDVGLAGEYKLGRWTPVRISLAADDAPWQGDLQISARDGDDVLSTYQGGVLHDLTVDADSPREVTAYIRVGRQESTLRISAINANGRRDASWNISLQPGVLATQQRVLTVGGDLGIRRALRLVPRPPAEAMLASHVESAAELPDNWLGYDGIDALLLTTARADTYAEMSTRQRNALSKWIELGGRLILTVGARGEEATADDSFVSQFIPGDFSRTLPLRETAVLETFAEATGRLDETGEASRRPPPLYTQLKNVQGKVLLSAGRDQPLIIRSASGFGQIIFVGIDLESEPFTDWEDTPRFLAKLLGTAFSESTRPEDRQQIGEAAHLGFDDISGQLRAALDVFQGVSVTPFSAVAALIVAFILLIGPVDYWLVARVLKRRELTWVTSTVIVISFCALAWWLAQRHRGSSVRTNQIDIVDVDTASNLLRGTTWVHVYSPMNRQFDLDLQSIVPEITRQDPPGMLFSWQGLPGDSLGGMDRQSRPQSGPAQYVSDNLAQPDQPPRIAIEGLPISAGGSKALAARWWTPTRSLNVQPLESSDDDLLAGHFDNPLPLRLTNCLLFHGRWVYRLGNLEPGQRVSPEDMETPLDAGWFLTERKIVDARDVTQPWDQAMRDDVPKIVRMMMFHELARGSSHTDLLHRHLSFIDLSELVRTDRAVLVGMTESPATQLMVDGQKITSEGDRRWTFYRVVIPTTSKE